MLVADLKATLEGVQERTLETTLGDIEVTEDASAIRLTKLGREFPLDEQAETSFAKYLTISTSYLAKCPPDLKAHNLNYWLRRKENAAAVIETVGDDLVSVHKPGLVILPLRRVADVIANTFDPQFEIVNLIRNATKFHLDVLTPHHVEVAQDSRIEDRRQGDRQVGDITHGGVRILANPIKAEAPVVSTYLHRLWCTNGCCSPARESQIELKGHTVDQVLEELEQAAQRVMGDLDNKLAEYAALANRRPPGSPDRFARQLGVEYALPQKLMNQILDRIEILPEDATLYDIHQVFTQMANSNIPYAKMMQLQSMAGELAFATDHVTHRCGTCERLLP